MLTGASRGPSGTEVNHHIGVENCTQILCKSSQYSQTLSHLSRPYWDFEAEGDEENVRIRQASLAFPSIFCSFLWTIESEISLHPSSFEAYHKISGACSNSCPLPLNIRLWQFSFPKCQSGSPRGTWTGTAKFPRSTLLAVIRLHPFASYHTSAQKPITPFSLGLWVYLSKGTYIVSSSGCSLRAQLHAAVCSRLKSSSLRPTQRSQDFLLFVSP